MYCAPMYHTTPFKSILRHTIKAISAPTQYIHSSLPCHNQLRVHANGPHQVGWVGINGILESELPRRCPAPNIGIPDLWDGAEAGWTKKYEKPPKASGMWNNRQIGNTFFPPFSQYSVASCVCEFQCESLFEFSLRFIRFFPPIYIRVKKNFPSLCQLEEVFVGFGSCDPERLTSAHSSPIWMDFMHSLDYLESIYLRRAILNGRHLLRSQTTFKAQSAVLVIKTSSAETTPRQRLHRKSFNSWKRVSQVRWMTSVLVSEKKFHPIFCCFRQMGMMPVKDDSPGRVTKNQSNKCIWLFFTDKKQQLKKLHLSSKGQKCNNFTFKYLLFSVNFSTKCTRKLMCCKSLLIN